MHSAAAGKTPVLRPNGLIEPSSLDISEGSAFAGDGRWKVMSRRLPETPEKPPPSGDRALDERARGGGWAERTAPSLDDFEVMAREALETLPQPFRGLVASVPCAVAEFADDETLDELGIESEFDLMGLFRGHGMTEDGAVPATGQLPNQIWLYRRPILDYWAEHEDETLGGIVTHVLVHEIGHHFGFSDADMEAIEAAADAG